MALMALVPLNVGSGTTDSDADPDNGLMSEVVTLAPGENNPNIDAGFYKTATIGDTVFNDLDGDGIQDAGEPGIAGATVKLLDADGNELDSTTTGSDGSYEFAGLTPGDYKVMFVQPDGFEGVSPANQGGDDSTDSDADPNNGLMSEVITLTSGEVNDTVDAGFFDVPAASLGDFVFEDSDADGVQDDGEQGIGGVTVKLLDADGNELDSTTTESDGSYGFTALTPGDYKVMFTQPDGFDGISPVNVGDDAADSDADPANGLMSEVVTLAPGENNPNIDAGFYKTATIGDTVFNDLDGDGIQDAGEPGIAGATVKLLDADGNELDSTTTGSDGFL